MKRTGWKNVQVWPEGASVQSLLVAVLIQGQVEDHVFLDGAVLDPGLESKQGSVSLKIFLRVETKRSSQLFELRKTGLKPPSINN